MLEAVLTGAVAGGTSILFAALGEIDRRAVRGDQPRHRGLDAVRRARRLRRRHRDGQPLARRARRHRRRRAARRGARRSWCCTAAPTRSPPAWSSRFLGIGLTALFGQDYVGQGVVRRSTTWPIPGLSRHPVPRADPVRPRPADVPVVRRRPAAWWVLFRTRAGLMLRAAGERPEVLADLRHVGRRRSAALAVARRRRAGRPRRRPAVDRVHPQLVGEHDRRPRLRRRGPGDLRRLGPAQGASPAPTSSAAPSPCSSAAGPGLRASRRYLLEALPVPRRHRRARRCSAGAGSTAARRRSARSSRADRRTDPTPNPTSQPTPDPWRPTPCHRCHPSRLRACCSASSLVVAACGGDDDDSGTDAATTGGTGADGRRRRRRTVGFIYVGPKDDFGYNQAAYEGSQAVGEAFPDLEVLQAENVPETAEAEAVMQDMIDEGADLIFATSYGHLEFAAEPGRAEPRRRVRAPGRPRGRARSSTTSAPTSAPCTSRCTRPASPPARPPRRGKLGYVYAFPIPQTLANINAFTLGAQSVEPRRSRRSRCRPAAGATRPLQAQAAQSLLDQGVDVITQHQDCTKTIIEATEAAGAYSVGYHADASELAPKGWLTGSEWDWGPLYTDIVQTVIDGEFAGSPTTTATSGSACRPATTRSSSRPFGPMVTAETKALDRGGQGSRSSPAARRSPARSSNQDGDDGLGRGRAADLRRGRDDGLLRRGRRRLDRLTDRMPVHRPPPPTVSACRLRRRPRPSCSLHGVGVGPESFAVTRAALAAPVDRSTASFVPGVRRGEARRAARPSRSTTRSTDIDRNVDAIGRAGPRVVGRQRRRHARPGRRPSPHPGRRRRSLVLHEPLVGSARARTARAGSSRRQRLAATDDDAALDDVGPCVGELRRRASSEPTAGSARGRDGRAAARRARLVAASRCRSSPASSRVRCRSRRRGAGR